MAPRSQIVERQSSVSICTADRTCSRYPAACAYPISANCSPPTNLPAGRGLQLDSVATLSISLSLFARLWEHLWVDAEASTLAHYEQVPVHVGAAVDPGRRAFEQRIQDEPEAATAPPSKGPASPGYWRFGKCWPAGEV